MAKIYPPEQSRFPIDRAHIRSIDEYRNRYQRSIEDPERFWAEVADRITWIRRWDDVRQYDFVNANIRWFEGATLNACYNCLDRHVEAGHGDQTAIIWEGNDPGDDRRYTFSELLAEVSRFANVLKANGIGKGDRVCLYLQMVPELAIAMLACARIGAVHSIVFGAFSAESLRDRINDSSCKLLITQDTAFRGPKGGIPMKANADHAAAECPSIEHIVVVRRTGDDVAFEAGRDRWWHEAMAGAAADCPPEPMGAEDPLFILYTSGSTGKPKGVLHTTGGYLLYASFTHETVFDYHPGDVYWCTADIGWITGHSYIIYGPLANRAITIMFEGVPNHPDPGRFWQVVAKHRVNIFYTAPTALRALMREGNQWVTPHDRSSLRLLGTVGEPIKEPEWKWYYDDVGEGRCPIVDTWWQTETGGILITPLPAVTPLKPGSATLPFFGVEPVLLDQDGTELTGNPATGYLCIKRSVARHHAHRVRRPRALPAGLLRHVPRLLPDRRRLHPRRRRLLLDHRPHRRRAQRLRPPHRHRRGGGRHRPAPAGGGGCGGGLPARRQGSGHLRVRHPDGRRGAERRHRGRDQAGGAPPHRPARLPRPDPVHAALPKTRSGKIMRRILRKIAEGETSPSALGDTSTLAEPNVVDDLVAGRK